jgi:hypothetical protein
MASFPIRQDADSVIRGVAAESPVIPPWSGLGQIPPLTEDAATPCSRYLISSPEAAPYHASPVIHNLELLPWQPGVPMPAPAVPEQQAPDAFAAALAPTSATTDSAYTIVLQDNTGLLAPPAHEQITNAVDYVARYLDLFMDWQGSIDITVRIKTHDEQLAEQGSRVDGITCATEGSWFHEDGWKKSNLIEATTGVDKNGSAADAGFTIYLGEDGTLRNYGAPVWVDPSPEAFVTPEIPDGAHDFVSIVLHELAHNLAFDGAFGDGSPFWSQVEEVDGQYVFQGTAVFALLGEGLAIETSNHIPEEFRPVSASGLMRSIGNYPDNRWDIGRIELAVLQDLGWEVIDDWSGIPLADMVDYAPHLTGTAADDALFGDFHDNSLTGLRGQDTLEGGSGDDLLGGAGGADLLKGGPGADALYGGRGSDRYEIDGADTLVEYAGEGADTVLAGFDHRLPANFEHLTLTGGTGIDGAGNGAANRIIGNGAGNMLTGGGGDDTLRSQGGPDILRGGWGNDTLSGGAGPDKFDFNTALDAGANVDRIAGFNAADDQIRLDDEIFVGLAVGTLAPGRLHQAPGAMAAHDVSDRVIYDTDTGRLYHDADGVGGADATLFAILLGAPTLTADDFVVVA